MINTNSPFTVKVAFKTDTQGGDLEYYAVWLEQGGKQLAVGKMTKPPTGGTGGTWNQRVDTWGCNNIPVFDWDLFQKTFKGTGQWNGISDIRWVLVAGGQNNSFSWNRDAGSGGSGGSCANSSNWTIMSQSLNADCDGQDPPNMPSFDIYIPQQPIPT